ncbi:MAG: hypothetical protein PHE32_02755 [Candidatus Shapirobacteria bacterium]|nr:hypothetical protein [Candidatus Shapirobacteria bacterium]MDD4410593.1 hypothetical protein [Candidatus Shapirobacteria bacterium]
MIDSKKYRDLGTSIKRKENKRDHFILQMMMDKEWFNSINFCHLTQEEIKEWQFKRIKQIVKHAYNNVPMYHDKYSKVGFHPKDLKNWKDFENLPILNKEEIIEAFPDRSISKKYNFKFTTRSSGSSGKFVTIVVSSEAIYRDTIQGARQFFFQSGGNYKPDDLALFIYTCPWWVSSINGKYKTLFYPTTTKIEEATNIIKQIRPKILSLYPTYLLKFYENSVPLKEYGVDLIIVHSEQTSSKQRLEMSNFFKIPVLDEFSSEELTRIALECPNKKYHLEEDACYVEIIDSKTHKNLSPGNQGMLIGTNLLNEATPIIRYFQGDIACIDMDNSCSCGSNFRTIKSFSGRFMDSIVSTYGEIIPASCFMDLAYNWYLEMNIPIHGLKYQIIQQTDGSIDINLQPKQYQISPIDKIKIKNSLYQLLPKDTTIRVKFVNRFLDTGSKFRPIISFKEKK